MASLDLSKFLDKNNNFQWDKFEIATRISVKFLDSVIDETGFPTIEIEKWAKENRAIGLGIMGFADLCLIKEIAYGSEDSLKLLENILEFMQKTAIDESENLGQKLGIPKECENLPVPRRNITVNSIQPTGTASIIAGCSSGIEPIFSEIVIRNDKTGTYTFENNLADKEYFRCAVSSNGAQEVSWEEHIKILASAQKYIQAGVSKTINFPQGTHRETIGKAAVLAWELGCKGVAMYRNNSRKTQVLTPKNIKKEKCPICGGEIAKINGKFKCTSCTEELIEDTTTYYD